MQNRTLFSRTPVLLTLGLPLLILVLIPLIALVSRTSPGQLLEYLHDDLTQKALRLSLTTSAASTLLIVVFGTPLACLLARTDFRGRKILETLLELAIVVPPAVAGIGLLMAFGRFGMLGVWLGKLGIQIPFTPLAVVMAQIFVSCPYFIKTATVGLASVDPELKHAAKLEGANEWQVFRHIVLPLASRGFIAGAAMSWARALGEFGATIIFAGNYPGRTQTLPLAVYLGFETGIDRALVLAVILLVLSFGFLFCIHWLTKKEVCE